MINSFPSGLGNRTHGYNHTFSIGSSVVVEEMVLAACDPGDFGHIAFYHFGHCFIVSVAGLTVLEEDVAVFCHTACNRVLGRERAAAEFGKSLAVEQRLEVFHLKGFYLLDFVRCTETVEEINERNAALDSRQVCNSGEIHNFLHRAFGKHCKAGLANRHHVPMVTEDRKGVGSDGTGGYMENCRQKLAGDFVHIRDHRGKPCDAV